MKQKRYPKRDKEKQSLPSKVPLLFFFGLFGYGFIFSRRVEFLGRIQDASSVFKHFTHPQIGTKIHHPQGAEFPAVLWGEKEMATNLENEDFRKSKMEVCLEDDFLFGVGEF